VERMDDDTPLLQESRRRREAQLGPRLAREWEALATTILAGRQPDWPRFAAATHAYLDALPTGENPDPYFDWIGNLALPRNQAPLGHTGLWEPALAIVLEWEGRRARHAHKGSGYYFAGLRDVALGNLDRGFLYMHQAAIEDAWPDEDLVPNSPAGWFVTMNAREVAGTAHEFVQRYEGYLAGQLHAYVAAGRGALDLDGFRARVAANAQLFTPVSTAAHVIARLLSIDSARLGPILENRFAPTLHTQLLMELCLVLEDVFQRLRGDRLVLGGHVAQAGLDRMALTTNDIGKVNELAATPASFDAFIYELLTTGGASAFGRPITDREVDFVIAVAVRNKAAHGGPRPTATDKNFDQLIARLFFAIFVVLEERYD
jgi:hypothetical protein